MRAARRRWGTAALVAVALLAALVAGGAGAGAAPRPDAGGQTDVPLSGACPGGLSIVAVPESGPPMCTHGPDPGVTPTDLAAQGGGRTEASAGIQCYGNGTSGPRVQLLYAYSGTNRLASLRDRMARRAAEVDAIFDASARQTGGERHVRWLTDANCDLDIRAVRVTSTAVPVTAFSSLLIPQLKSAGYTSSSRKYLVWVDTGTSITVGGNVACSGIGTLYADEEPDPERNYNNTQGGYTRVDDKCLFPVFDPVGGKVEAHEL
ncbi:MAG: hypothetical protein KDB35_10755, partial [Acidimicrobiales bacterium]|nr:hypothetical protein [Acidimicrobiales bacterium]